MEGVEFEVSVQLPQWKADLEHRPLPDPLAAMKPVEMDVEERAETEPAQVEPKQGKSRGNPVHTVRGSTPSKVPAATSGSGVPLPPMGWLRSL